MLCSTKPLFPPLPSSSMFPHAHPFCAIQKLQASSLYRSWGIFFLLKKKPRRSHHIRQLVGGVSFFLISPPPRSFHPTYRNTTQHPFPRPPQGPHGQPSNSGKKKNGGLRRERSGGEGRLCGERTRQKSAFSQASTHVCVPRAARPTPAQRVRWLFYVFSSPLHCFFARAGRRFSVAHEAGAIFAFEPVRPSQPQREEQKEDGKEGVCRVGRHLPEGGVSSRALLKNSLW